MSKKKKNKQQAKKSESSLVVERARKLPFYKCYINANWKECGLASIIVSRKHINGNLTVGFFEVDLYLKGVKDAFTRFNVPEYLLKDDLDNTNVDHIEVNYNLVHNIIYGSIEFAEDYGFLPCREWKVAHYVLEEDTDDIPLIDIEFGKNGKPFIFDLDGTFEKDIKILEKNTDQEYNFAGNIDMEDKFEEDETIQIIQKIVDADYEKYVDKKYRSSEKGILRFIKEINLKKNMLGTTAFINKIFFDTEGYKYFQGIDLIDYTIGDTEISDVNDFYDESLKEVLGNKKNISEEQIEEILIKHPYSDFIYLICFIKLYIKQNESIEKIVKRASALVMEYPDSLAAVSNYLLWLAYTNNETEFNKIIQKSDYFNKVLNTEKGINQIIFINYCMIRAFDYIFKNNLIEADRFYMAVKLMMGVYDLHFMLTLSSVLADMKFNYMSKKIEELEKSFADINV